MSEVTDYWKPELERQQRRANAADRDLLQVRKALRWMIDDAERSQRPGGGSGVPAWVREALREHPSDPAAPAE